MIKIKKYSLKKIREIIEKYKNNGLERADVGMYEDWNPTAVEIWNTQDGYTIDNELQEDEIHIAGINGSGWATPQIALYFKDGTELDFDVYTDDGGKIIRPNAAAMSMVSMFDSMLGFDTNRKRDE